MNITLKSKTNRLTAEGSKTGIVRLTARKVETPQLASYHWKMIVDVSASMDEHDGKSKRTRLENVRSTLMKLFEYLHKQTNEENKPKHIVDIVTFSGTGQTQSYTFDIGSNEGLTNAKALTESLQTNGMTDISSAISATTMLTTIPNSRICVVMLTDGAVTTGCSNPYQLKEQLDNYITDLEKIEGSLGVSCALVGYGIDHDAELLEILATNKYAEYHCVESSEGAGAVYGEIAHGFTYEGHRDVRIEINGALLHNGETDEWVSAIYVGRMADQAQRTWLWKADGSGIEVSVEVISMMYERSNFLKVKTTDTINACIVPEDGVVDREVIVYELRAKSQSLMCEARNFMQKKLRQYKQRADLYGLMRSHMTPYPRSKQVIRNDAEKNEETDTVGNLPPRELNKRTRKETLKTRLMEWLTELKKWIEENGEDAIVRTLCDDIYITLRGIEASNGKNFIIARHTSQGKQRSYNPSDITALDDEELYNEAINHTTSQELTSPYAPLSAVAMMRAVSQDSGDTH